MTPVLVALGSNAGDRAQQLDNAVTRLAALRHTRFLRESSRRETPPVGGPEQSAFLNSAALLETELSPLEFLAELQRIEAEGGRTRGLRWGPRTIDLDLLFFGELELASETLTVPHLRCVFRRFVLEPAAELAPEMIHPINGWSLARLLDNLNHGPHAIALCGSRAEKLQRDCEPEASLPLLLGPRLDVKLLIVAGGNAFTETFRRRADAPPSFVLPDDTSNDLTEVLAAIAAME